MVDRGIQDDLPRGQLVPREHTAYDGTPFYDEVLQVPQSEAHRIMVYETGSILASVAEEAGLRFLSDQPIWYLDPEEDRQRAYYGDWVIANRVAPERITAYDLRAVIEVVSVASRKKEVKDTQFQRALNEYNEVPEFGLVFPEADDPRALRWYRLVEGKYEELVVSPGGEAEVAAVPGLVLRVRPKGSWADGRKIDVVYKGELRPPLTGERARADQERARADQERARAERLAEQLRALGVDPDRDERPE